MGGIDPAALDRSIEAIVRRDRLVALVALGAVCALAWFWLGMMARDMIANPSTSPGGFEPVALSLTLAMWIVMMAGMMLPSAAPAILLYASMVRGHDVRGSALPPLWLFSLGYLIAWSAFSVVATLAQGALEHASLLDSSMTSTSARLSAALLFVAGIYQFTPLKLACLGKCASPLQFFLTRWRNGAAGAVRMGINHGVYCVGCCWALMALLFAFGVMHLAWIAALTAFVLVEKIWPVRALSRVAGIVLIVAGVWRLMG